MAASLSNILQSQSTPDIRPSSGAIAGASSGFQSSAGDRPAAFSESMDAAHKQLKDKKSSETTTSESSTTEPSQPKTTVTSAAASESDSPSSQSVIDESSDYIASELTPRGLELSASSEGVIDMTLSSDQTQSVISSSEADAGVYVLAQGAPEAKTHTQNVDVISDSPLFFDTLADGQEEGVVALDSPFFTMMQRDTPTQVFVNGGGLDARTLGLGGAEAAKNDAKPTVSPVLMANDFVDEQELLVGTKQARGLSDLTAPSGFMKLAQGNGDPSAIAVSSKDVGTIQLDEMMSKKVSPELALTLDKSLIMSKASLSSNAGDVINATSVSVDQSLTSTANANQSALVNSLAGVGLSVSEVGRVSVAVNVSFTQPQWTAAMAEKAAWAVSQNIQSVDIQLDPPELGPLQIKVHVSQDQASVNFISANPAVREALEQSMLRLKDMLHEQGMALVDSGVSGQSQEQGSEERASAEGLASEGVDSSEPQEQQMNIDITNGIDYFA